MVRKHQTRNLEIPGSMLTHRPGMTVASLHFQSLVGDDLDAETGQSLVVVHRGSQVDDRGDTEVAQDLRTDADLAPLPVAVGLRRLGLAERSHWNAGSTIAQIDQHAAP